MIISSLQAPYKTLRLPEHSKMTSRIKKITRFRGSQAGFQTISMANTIADEPINTPRAHNQEKSNGFWI